MSTSSASRRKPAFRVLYESAEITITSWHIHVDGLRINVSELRAVERHMTYGYFRKNPRYLEIHATLRGRRIVLFGTRDDRIFGFVWRALVRAVEDNRLLHPYDG
jgi:hypothetical protein